MEALIETTGGQFHPHTYLLDGTTLIAYIKASETEPFYFKHGIKHFDKRGRTFKKTDANQFKVQAKASTIEVKGSGGKTYYVDPEAKSCTCPGYAFRGACKHLAEIG
jgi:hypothetical protein